MTFKAANLTTVRRRENRSGAWCYSGIRILFLAALNTSIYAQTQGSLVPDRPVFEMPLPVFDLQFHRQTVSGPDTPYSVDVSTPAPKPVPIAWGPESVAIPDRSARPYIRCSFASQGSQGLREGSGGLPQGFQVLHVSCVNRSGASLSLSASAIYLAAVEGGFVPLGPEAAAAVLAGPARRGKWAVFTRILDAAPAGITIGLAAVRANPNAQLVNGGLQVLAAYLRSGVEARRVDPRAAISRLLAERDSEGHSVMLQFPIAGGWAGDIGALYRVSTRHRAVTVDIREDGDAVIHSSP